MPIANTFSALLVYLRNLYQAGGCVEDSLLWGLERLIFFAENAFFSLLYVWT